MKWEPIETAPKDGRHVIGYFGGRYAESVYWCGEAWCWTQDGDTPLIQPTHWMPLPEPPK